MKTNPNGHITSDNTQLSLPKLDVCKSSLSCEPTSRLQLIAEDVQKYLAAATAENTRRAYRDDIADFERFGCSVPCAPELVAQYIAFRAKTCASATITRRLVGIGRAHTTQGFCDPTKSDLVRTVVKGIRRTHGSAQRRAKPLTVEDLLMSLPPEAGTRCLRDRALLLIGFAAALRRSELVSLDISDLSYSTQGIEIRVRKGKSDAEGFGRTIAIPIGRSPRACAVLAARAWTSEIGESAGPLFRPIAKSGRVRNARLTAASVSSVIKKAMAKAGIDPSGYTGHSLRAGLITSAARAGVSIPKIMEQSGHRTVQTLMRYIREARVFEANAAGAVL